MRENFFDMGRVSLDYRVRSAHLREGHAGLDAVQAKSSNKIDSAALEHFAWRGAGSDLCCKFYVL